MEPLQRLSGRACDIAIADGKIVEIGTQLGEAARTIDTAGKIVVPGGIDSHVHISQPLGRRHRHGR